MSDWLDGHTSAFRQASGLRFLEEIGFDPKAYVDAYPDLVWTGSPLRAAIHYLNFGSVEGRSIQFAVELPQALRALEASPIVAPRKRTLARALALSRLQSLAPHAEHLDALPQLLEPSTHFQPLLVFGDSHAIFYNSTALLREAGRLPVIFTYPASSARGLDKVASRMNTGPRISAFVESNADRIRASSAALLFGFGQVDIEFLFHFKRAQSGATAFDHSAFTAFQAESITAYFDFLAGVRRQVGRQTPIIVSGVFPPALQDGRLFKDRMVFEYVASMNDLDGQVALEAFGELEFPDLKARTTLHRVFNVALQRRCEAEGYSFIETFDDFLGEDGVVADEFTRSHAGADHHLDVGTLEVAMVASFASRRLVDLTADASRGDRS